MRLRVILSGVLTCFILVNCFCMSVIGSEAVTYDGTETVMRATGKFSMEVPGNTAVQASSSFPLEAGEIVTIKASYTPFSASVDFGLIAPDGYFYSLNTTNGSFDEAIEVDQRGNYVFAVRNNSETAISVSGYVNY